MTLPVGLPERVTQPGIPDAVTIWEVAPRDGLQAETIALSVDDRIHAIRMLADAVIVGGDHHPVHALHCHGRVPTAPDQAARMAGCAAQFHQRLARIAGRGMAGGNDDQDRHLRPSPAARPAHRQ